MRLDQGVLAAGSVIGCAWVCRALANESLQKILANPAVFVCLAIAAVAQRICTDDYAGIFLEGSINESTKLR
jgi:hypothetical protein